MSKRRLKGRLARTWSGMGAPWRSDDPWAGMDRPVRPAHGTVGPAKRGFACAGPCWDPNRYGVCRVCGGSDPLQQGGR